MQVLNSRLEQIKGNRRVKREAEEREREKKREREIVAFTREFRKVLGRSVICQGLEVRLMC